MYSKSRNLSKSFSNRKVSPEQARRILIRKGIIMDDDQANKILDFLYLIAKTIPEPGDFKREFQTHKKKSNTEIVDLHGF